MVEIGRHEVRVIVRQEPVGPVVEALSGDVHVVGVEDPMHESCGHPGAGQSRRAPAGLLEQRDPGIGFP